MILLLEVAVIKCDLKKSTYKQLIILVDHKIVDRDVSMKEACLV